MYNIFLSYRIIIVRIKSLSTCPIWLGLEVRDPRPRGFIWSVLTCRKVFARLGQVTGPKDMLALAILAHWGKWSMGPGQTSKVSAYRAWVLFRRSSIGMFNLGKGIPSILPCTPYGGVIQWYLLELIGKYEGLVITCFFTNSHESRRVNSTYP